MSEAGLSDSGLSIKRLPEIEQELADELKNTFGEIDTSADSVFGQIIGVLSKPLADLWEQLEHIYFSQYPDTASGVPLDFAVALTGITREAATFSQGEVGLKGIDGTVVPSLTQIAQETTGILFQTIADVTITLTDVTRIIMSIDTAVEGNTYSVFVNEETASYTAVFGDTIIDIAEKLVDAIEASVDVSAYITAVDNGNGSISLTAKSGVVTFDTPPTDMSWWSPASIIALDKGAIPAPAGTLNVIVNAVAGLDAVNNFTAIDLEHGIGRNVETDNALRLRRIASLKVSGAASVEAIRARILSEVDGVSACMVIENATDIYDAVNEMDPHSIKVIVVGGVSLDIGRMIWQVKAAGIKVMGGTGAIAVTFLDSQGNSQTMYYFRPTTKYAWVRVGLNSSDPLLLPSDWATQVQQKIYDWGLAGSTIGQDIIFQEIYGIIYQVPGILDVDLHIALTDTEASPDPGDWVQVNIEIDKSSYAEYALSRIDVQIAP